MVEPKFKELVEIVKKLRKECPWDREQTNDSIKSATIEEAYEVVEAIEGNDYDELEKELGDLLLHVIFHSVIAEENGKFTLEEVIDSIQSKLIRRHPHVFGEAVVSGAEEVKKNWEVIKLEEGRKSVLEGIPKELPSLQRAFRIQEKASKVGFDWEKKEDVWKKVIEEIGEMQNAEKRVKEKEGDESIKNQLEMEVGDVFFALVNYCRFLNVNPENALRLTNNKFIQRFYYIEKKIAESGKDLIDSSLEEMDKYWNESKII
jgi:MazG family protein